MDITSCGHHLVIPEIYVDNFVSEVSIRDRFWHIAEGDVVLDIGASVGIYTLPALACGARVFAIDVLDETPLDCMAQDNGLAEKLVIIRCAVGDVHRYPPELMAAVRADEQSGGSMYPGLLDDCAWSTVDKIVAEYGIERVDWIKIDTEGGELPILQGAAATLTRDHPKLLIEEHSHIEHIRAMDNAPRLRELLSGHGYMWEEVPYENRALWYCVPLLLGGSGG
jgi:FkbM family methyltransferase